MKTTHMFAYGIGIFLAILASACMAAENLPNKSNNADPIRSDPRVKNPKNTSHPPSLDEKKSDVEKVARFLMLELRRLKNQSRLLKK